MYRSSDASNDVRLPGSMIGVQTVTESEINALDQFITKELTPKPESRRGWRRRRVRRGKS